MFSAIFSCNNQKYRFSYFTTTEPSVQMVITATPRFFNYNIFSYLYFIFLFQIITIK